jgi:hypothetical protein
LIHQFMSKRSDSEKKLVYITIFVVFVSAVFCLLIFPGWDKVSVTDNDIAKKEKIIKADLRIINDKDNITARSEAFNKFIVDKLEPNDVVNRGFLSAIERLASQSKVTLTKSNPTDIKTYKRYVEYYANLDCTGELENVITFMHAINSSDDLLKIVRFDLLPKKGTDNEVTASMSVVKLVMSREAPVVASK